MGKKICPRCLNEDPSYFYKGNKGWYCRKCISFGRALLEEDRIPNTVPIRDGSEEYTLRYPLTEKQKEIAQETCNRIYDTDILIQAVCGAGKTEMVVPLIAMALREKKSICFAIARRQVVLELHDRLQSYFSSAKVVAVCGGHTKELEGDLIICTTHQLYRYYHQFDILILDEPDAFPFRGNEVLHGIARTSCKGHRLFLTATPDDELIRGVQNKSIHLLKLNRRPHGNPLPVPEVKMGPLPYLFLELVSFLHQHRDHPRMVFVPTISIAKTIGYLLGKIQNTYICTSKTENRDEVIHAFREEKAGVIVATTVLERGVTIEKADIVVFHADHSVFDKAGLVQMAGRAGRSFQYPTGSVLFLTRHKCERVDACVSDIAEANACDA